MRIQTLFSLTVFSAGSLGLAAMVADRAFMTRDILRERLETRGQAVAESIGALALPRLKDGTPLDLRAMKLFSRLPGIDYVLIHDRNGQPIYQDAPKLDRFRRESSSDRLPIRHEIRDGDAGFGYVRLGLSLQKIHSEIRESSLRGAGVAICVLALLAALSWYLGKLLGRHLESFTRALERFDPRMGSGMSWLLRRSELTRVWGAFNDLHARLEEEAQKRDTIEKLKNDLAGMIVHDLKHPLTVLRTVLMVIRDPSLGDKESIAAVNPMLMADRAIMRLNSMIEEVLQIARLNDSDMPLTRQRIPVRQFLDDCTRENRLIVEHAGRLFHVVTEDAAGGRWIFADRPLLERLVGNLILNAVEHSQPDAPVTLGARVSAQADRIEIFVHNEHSSAAGGQIAKYFKKYATPGESLRNVGLGLAFCELVANRHGAALSAVSSEKDGMTFTLDIPASEYPVAKPGVSSPQEQPDAAPTGGPT